MTNKFCLIATAIILVVVVIAWACYTVKTLFDCGIDLIDVQEKSTKKILINAIESVLVSVGCLIALVVFAKLAITIIAISLM